MAAIAPYRGLSSYGESESDALLFFGRAQDVEIVVANLVASRLTVLYGPSGVGKSSLLRAGVARSLRELAEQPLVIVFARWGDDPSVALADAVATAAGLATGAGLLETVRQVASGRDLYLVLDQAEEYFLYHPRTGSFERQLAELVSAPLRVDVLLSIREDALAKLDRFKALIPNILGNYLRLDRLDRRAGERAIRGPLERLPSLGGPRVTIEPTLVDRVLDEVTVGRITAAGAEPEPAPANGSARIEAPFLQLVMQRLWDIERDAGADELGVAALERLGGSSRIVADHLERALGALEPSQQNIASELFNHLVTPSGAKIAQQADDLAEYAGVPEPTVEPVLSSLSDHRIVRRDDGGRFEIFHDVLAEAVLAWRVRHERERAVAAERSRRRRAVGVAIVALVAVAVMVAVTAFAVGQRQDARQQATVARARALDAFATSQLLQDPELSVALASNAAKLSATPQAEEVLRGALLADHLRWVIRTGGPVRAVSFDPGGTRAIVASEDGIGRLVGSRSHKLIAELRHRAAINDAAFSGDGHLVVTASRDRSARIWDVATGRRLAVLLHPGPVAAATFVSGDRVITASGHSVRLWSERGGTALRTFRQPVPASRGLLSPDGRLVIALGTDRFVRVFAEPTGKMLRTLDQQAAPNDAMFRGDGTLAVGDQRGTVRLWDPARGTLKRVLLGHRGHVQDVEWSPDGSRLVTASTDGTARVWDAATGTILNLLEGGTNFVESAAFSRDGRFVVTAGRDRTARTWGADDGHQYAFLTGSPAPLTAGVYRPDGREVVTAGDDGAARFWDPETDADLIPARVPRPSAPARTATSRDGRTTATVDGDVVEISGPSGRHRLGGHHDVVNSVAFSADGSMVVTASRDHDARLWDARSGRLLHVLSGHFGSVADARFSPDGRWIATAGPSTAGLWRVADGALFQYLRGPTDGLTSVDFRQTGVVTHERNGIVRRFACTLCGRLDDLVAIADERLRATGRTLSTEELHRFG